MVYAYICNFIWGFRICNKNQQILLLKKVYPIIIDEKSKNTLQIFFVEGKNFFLVQNLQVFIADSESGHKITYRDIYDMNLLYQGIFQRDFDLKTWNFLWVFQENQWKFPSFRSITSMICARHTRILTAAAACARSLRFLCSACLLPIRLINLRPKTEPIVHV